MSSMDAKLEARLRDAGLLFLRAATSAMMLPHGIAKISSYGERVESFVDPIGLGSALSLQLAIFAEVGCSLSILAGAYTRLSALPLLFTMGVAAFVVHWEDPWSRKEFALLYAVIYASLILLGGGRYSIDALLDRRAKLSRTS